MGTTYISWNEKRNNHMSKITLKRLSTGEEFSVENELVEFRVDDRYLQGNSRCLVEMYDDWTKKNFNPEDPNVFTKLIKQD